MKLTEKQKEVLEKYQIQYKDINVDELLDLIFDRMHDFLDKEDEPLPECLELEEVYDKIYYNEIQKKDF